MSPCLPLVRPAGKVWKRLIYELLTLLGNILPSNRIFKVFRPETLTALPDISRFIPEYGIHRGCAAEQARLLYGLRAFAARARGFL